MIHQHWKKHDDEAGKGNELLETTSTVGGPLIALIISVLALPWYAPVFGLLIILAGIRLSYRLLTRGWHEVEAVFIIPEHRRKRHS